MATTNLNGRRTPESVRRDIERERRGLADAVEQLRDGIGEATNVSEKLRGRMPAVAAGALGAGFFLAGGVGATMRFFARKGRDR